MNNSQESKQKISTKQGDIIRLGKHVLYCGDALSVNVKSLHKEPIHLILTDPPYAVDYVASKRGIQKTHTDKDIANDGFMTDKEYIEFSEKWLTCILPHLTSKNSIYVFNSDKMIFALRSAFINLGIKVSQLIVWIKNSAVVGRLDYLPQHELILYGWKGTHHFRRSKGKSVLFAPKPTRSKLHPTMKPVGLLRKLILNSTRIGDTVYDPFGGSGSTLVACEHTKRTCIMVEMDPAYCNTIIKRWQKITYGKQQIIHTQTKA